MHQQTAQKTDFLWLEITGKCQLRCFHCYAESGPSGTHGTMTATGWLSVIDQAVGLGVSMIQLTGAVCIAAIVPHAHPAPAAAGTAAGRARQRPFTRGRCRRAWPAGAVPGRSDNRAPSSPRWAPSPALPLIAHLPR